MKRYKAIIEKTEPLPKPVQEPLTFKYKDGLKGF